MAELTGKTILELPSVSTIDDGDYFVLVHGSQSSKASGALINNVVTVTFSAINSLPQTVTNSIITANHVLINYFSSNYRRIASDLTVTTSNGSLTVTGTLSGAIDLTLVLAKSSALS